jgi:hypothetical protein
VPSEHDRGIFIRSADLLEHREQSADPGELAVHRQDSATILGKLDGLLQAHRCEGVQPPAALIAERPALASVRKIWPMRILTSVAMTIAGVTFAAFPANSLHAEVLVQGQAGDVRVEAHDATVDEILAALGQRFALRYRGATESNSVTATFEGPLRRVVGRVLDGYNYVIQTRDDGLEVVVLGAASSHAMSAPVYTSPSYPAKKVRRTD